MTRLAVGLIPRLSTAVGESASARSKRPRRLLRDDLDGDDAEGDDGQDEVEEGRSPENRARAGGRGPRSPSRRRDRWRTAGSGPAPRTRRWPGRGTARRGGWPGWPAAPRRARGRAPARSSASRIRQAGAGKWDRVVAPKTTKTAWHSDTWRDRPTRSDRLAKSRTKASVVVAVTSLRSGEHGRQHRSGRGQRSVGRAASALRRRSVAAPVRTDGATTSLNRPRRLATSTTNSTMNGRAAGRPARFGRGGHQFGGDRRGDADAVGAEIRHRQGPADRRRRRRRRPGRPAG